MLAHGAALASQLSVCGQVVHCSSLTPRTRPATSTTSSWARSATRAWSSPSPRKRKGSTPNSKRNTRSATRGTRRWRRGSLNRKGFWIRTPPYYEAGFSLVVFRVPWPLRFKSDDKSRRRAMLPFARSSDLCSQYLPSSPFCLDNFSVHRKKATPTIIYPAAFPSN